MKIEVITLDFIKHSIVHVSSSGSKTIELDKKTLLADAMKYIENYCSEMGFEVLAPLRDATAYVYHLVKK